MKKLLLLLPLLAFACLPLGSAAFVSGNTACPSSGAKQVSSVAIFASSVTVQAPVANTGTIYVGGPTITTSSGVGLLATQSQSWGPAPSGTMNLQTLYFACSVSGDSMSWNAVQ